MRCWTNNVAKSHLSPSPFNSRVLRSCLVCNAHTCLIDFVINDTLRTVTGCLQPTPGDNHLIFANIQPADVCCKVTILHTILWSLEGCSTQCSFIHRVRMHGIPNRDIYWYTPHSNSSVHPRTATEAQWSEQITNTVKYGVVRQHHETPYFHSDIDTHPLDISLPRTAWIRLTPQHRCRTFLLLLASMEDVSTCGLLQWCRKADRWPCCSSLSNSSASPWSAWSDGSGLLNNGMIANTYSDV